MLCYDNPSDGHEDRVFESIAEFVEHLTGPLAALCAGINDKIDHQLAVLQERVTAFAGATDNILEALDGEGNTLFYGEAVFNDETPLVWGRFQVAPQGEGFVPDGVAEH